MHYNFSSNNSLHEFTHIKTDNHIYLSFACEPQINAFSQKYRGSQYGSTTETLIDNLDKLKIQKSIDTVVTIHLVQGMVTLDGATAVMPQKPKEELKEKPWNYLKSTLVKSKEVLSLHFSIHYMLLLCLCSVVKQNFKGDDQLNERNQFILETYHEALEVVLDNNKMKITIHHIDLWNLFQILSLYSQSEVMKIEIKIHFSGF